MTTAVLHGSLARTWGKSHSFDASTVFLTMQGLYLQLGEKFKQQVQNGAWHIVLGKPDKAKTNAIGDEQVHQQLGKETEFHIFPAFKGKSGAVRVVIGIVLIVVGVVFEMPFLVQMGAGMVIGGVAEMLAKKPNLSTGEAGANDPNYFFNGGTNTNEQGGPVPVVFGRVQRAGSVVISEGIMVEQLQDEV